MLLNTCSYGSKTLSDSDYAGRQHNSRQLAGDRLLLPTNLGPLLRSLLLSAATNRALPLSIVREHGAAGHNRLPAVSVLSPRPPSRLPARLPSQLPSRMRARQ
jgi:hypothetical protein